MESMVGDITPASALTVATPPHSWTQAIDRPAPHQHLRAACVPGGGDEDGMQEARGQLKTYFGYNAFRVGQVLLHAGVCQLSIFLWMGRSLPGVPARGTVQTDQRWPTRNTRRRRSALQ